ncbi:hypothetical protein BDV95DRAFT_611650 [Massariosphaeria phaeospora]|uniref:Uncharacterized protein n=1 Tax=Massariosphaeria phaeospora TaxID=100035 RepID=A0A7C8HZS2_9PLEO|nr:hypothetical protein BDV95DRAFT_611650 [Massariosphaeria phaeospora]
MEYFADIAALALGPIKPASLEEAVSAYEKDGVTRMVKLWKKFAFHLPSPSREIETTTPFQTLPPSNWIKAYMSWGLETGTPRLDAKLTVKTLLKEFEQLRRVLRLALDESMANKDVQVVKKFIRQLSAKGASTKSRHKSLAYGLDTDEI